MSAKCYKMSPPGEERLKKPKNKPITRMTSDAKLLKANRNYRESSARKVDESVVDRKKLEEE